MHASLEIYEWNGWPSLLRSSLAANLIASVKLLHLPLLYYSRSFLSLDHQPHVISHHSPQASAFAQSHH